MTGNVWKEGMWMTGKRMGMFETGIENAGVNGRTSRNGSVSAIWNENECVRMCKSLPVTSSYSV